MFRQKYILLLFSLALAGFGVVGCDTDGPEPEKQIRLSAYELRFDEDSELNAFWTRYSFDDAGRISQIVFNDTTFLKARDQFETTTTVYTYTYDTEGFLTKRATKVSSIFQERESEILYEYAEGRLDLENFGNRVTEYRYNPDGSVKETIATSLFTGNKVVLKYANSIPEGLNKTADGYLQEDDDEKLYYDEKLREVRYERYRDGELFFERTKEYGPPKLHLSTLPLFKGFPKIKDFDARNGIEVGLTSFVYENGEKIPVERKQTTPTYNAEGYIESNIGTESLDLNTDMPRNRQLEFNYYYEYF